MRGNEWRLLVTGTRRGHSGVRIHLDGVVCAMGSDPVAVILGDADGVDAQALMWAMFRGFKHEVLKADWERLGKRAGPARNAAMVARCKVGDVCAALPDANSVGTWDCVRRAHACGLGVFICPLTGR